MKSFPYGYEISTKGHCRKITPHGYIHFRPYKEDNGIFVDIPVDGKINKCLVAELVLGTFGLNHIPGNRIEYRDRNIFNITLGNLKSLRGDRVKDGRILSRDENRATVWGCESRARSSNARCLAISETISAKDVFETLVKDGFCCFYCGDNLSPTDWHLDHYEPVSRGGRNAPKNLRASCPLCNVAKSDMTMPLFISKIVKILSRHGQKVY